MRVLTRGVVGGIFLLNASLFADPVEANDLTQEAFMLEAVEVMAERIGGHVKNHLQKVEA